MQKNSSRMNEVESDQECQCLVFFPMYFRGRRGRRRI